jgi:hypothetical protein
MGGTCSMRRREMYEDFRWGSLNESDHLEDLEVKLMIFFEKDYKEISL